MTTSVRRAVTVALAVTVIALLALTAWLLLDEAGGSVLDRGVRCGSVLQPLAPPRGIMTDCRTALGRRRHEAFTAAAAAAFTALLLVAVRLRRGRTGRCRGASRG